MRWLFSIMLMFAFALMATAIPNNADNQQGFFIQGADVIYAVPGETVPQLDVVVINSADDIYINYINNSGILESPSAKIEEASTIRIQLYVTDNGKATLQLTNRDKRGGYGSLNKFVLSVNNYIYIKLVLAYYGLSFDSMNKLLWTDLNSKI